MELFTEVLILIKILKTEIIDVLFFNFAFFYYGVKYSTKKNY